MILCPNCHSKEATGTLYCSQCGALMMQTEGLPTQAVVPEPSQGIIEQPAKKYTGPLISASVSLHILDAGQIVPLSEKKEYIIGRCDENQPNQPDIDLGPYRGYEKGVSRLHACLNCVEQSVTITDLSSVNGTRINGVKISPDKPFALSHGDILSFGKLKIQIFIRR